jgi:oxygen-dependent protoporphyrinogen oxidase
MKQRRESAGKRSSLCNLRGGLKALVAAIAAQLGDSALTGAEIAAIRRSTGANAQKFDVTYKLGGATESLSIGAIVVATAADEAARLLNGVEPAFGELLGRIQYAGVAQVSAGYGLEQIEYRNAEKGLDGFGFLVPRSEGLRLLGTVWNSSLFPARALRGMASFTSFLGGMTDAEIVSCSPEHIAAIAHSELSAVLGVTGAPVVQHVARWQRALPQYNIGHQSVTAALRSLCAATPGIFLAGNYLAGPPIGACLEHANEVAGRVARFYSAASPAPASPAY